VSTPGTPDLDAPPRDSIERAAEILSLALIEGPYSTERNVVSGLYAIADALARIAACLEDDRLEYDRS
jgi:hypothetical protein